MKRLSTSLSIAIGRAQLMYKSHSFPWHGYSVSPGLAARAGKEAGGFTWGSRPVAFFRVIAITAIGPFFRTVETDDKLQIRLIIIHSSLPASFQDHTNARSFAFACRCNIPVRSSIASVKEAVATSVWDACRHTEHASLCKRCKCFSTPAKKN